MKIGPPLSLVGHQNAIASQNQRLAYLGNETVAFVFRAAVPALSTRSADDRSASGGFRESGAVANPCLRFCLVTHCKHEGGF